MSKTYSSAEIVENLAGRLLPTYHAELATARIQYIFVDVAGKKNGRPVLGKVRKVSGALEYLLEIDFLMEVAADKWNDLNSEQREALIDHLLERCTGEEDEKTGNMKWQLREPDVQEFATVLRRHGAWNDDLVNLITVAQDLELDEGVQEVVAAGTQTTNAQAQV